jgi:UDP-N-acetylglucosamine/UDP-N-acetylgalactosamine diphosphorylase
MKALNIEILSYIQVDNPLVTAIDLGFIGLHAEVDSEMSSKVVRKRSVDEKVGIFVQENQQLKVVEYSDMPLEIANKKNPDGQYCFELGNVAIHLLNRRFIEKILASGDLPLHVARKVTPFIDNFGTMVTPYHPMHLS